MKIEPPIRKQDSYGSGEYDASRGTRKHKGIDYECPVGSKVFSLVNGLVTKLGHSYSDDLSFRYVQITTEDGFNVRTHYVKPTISIGRKVTKHSILGVSQKLGDRYPKDESHKEPITEHVHVEVFELINNKRNYVNPKEYFSEK